MIKRDCSDMHQPTRAERRAISLMIQVEGGCRAYKPYPHSGQCDIYCSFLEGEEDLMWRCEEQMLAYYREQLT